MSRSRKWCFTLNNYDEPEVITLRMLLCNREKVSYGCFGKEVAPETGTPHLQGFVYFQNAVGMGYVKRIVGLRAHVEIAKGTIEQNVTYCSKEGEFSEFGERPKSLENKVSSKGQPIDYDQAVEFAKSDKMELLPSNVLLRYGRALDWVRNRYLLTRQVFTLEPGVHNEWYWGPAGTGKSWKARSENPDCFLKMCNKWWDGYQDQDVVLIEDFDKNHSVLCHHLKIWGDIYPFPAEVKGGALTVRPKKVIITSNYSPDQIWELESDLEPILRRFKCIHFDTLKIK